VTDPTDGRTELLQQYLALHSQKVNSHMHAH